jgi:Secretion system C-terminal sorting domain
MKPYPIPVMLLLLVSVSALQSASAQPQTLEFAAGSGPTSFGSTISNQLITFQENTANPTAWSFSPYSSPTTTATFSVSNQQQTLPARQNANGAVVSFGATNNNSTQLITPAKIFPQMNAVSAAAANDFSSSATAGQAGEGMSMTQNYGLSVFTSVMGLYNLGANTHDSFYMANLTITFNVPVTNPVLHIVGIGGFAGSEGFSSELMLTTGGVTLSKLSGSTGFLITPNQILNSSRTFTATTGSGAASGSVLVTGTNISSLTFQVWLKGDGGASTWSTSSEHAGDEFLIGISSLVTDLVLPVTFSGFTAQSQGDAALLNWTAAMEENSNYFEVQTSRDGTSWNSIGEVKAAGNSATPTNYTFTDNTPVAGNNYYRVVEVSLDNTEIYSVVRQLSFGQATVLTFYPNPVKNQVTINTGSTTPQSVTLMSVSGRQLQQNNQFVSGGSIDLSSYAAGIYFLAIRNTSGQTEVLKILKN